MVPPPDAGFTFALWSARLSLGLTAFKINFVILVYVNEEGNTVAEKAVEAALTYTNKGQKLGVQVNLQKVVGERTDSDELLVPRK